MKNLFKSVFVLLLATVLVACGGTKKETTKQASKTKKVLFVLSSNDQLGSIDKRTGVWLEEFTSPYYALKEQGIEVTIVSPKGGQVPFDPGSLTPESATESTKRYDSDQALHKVLAHTSLLSSVKAEDFDAVFYPGGHGLLWDLVENKQSIALIEDFYKADKLIASVCHGPAVFAHPKKANGQSILEGKKVTGFSNAEENMIQLGSVVPFMLEDKMKENGGIYANGESWKSFVQVDGKLITGQNPGSSSAVASELIKALL